MALQFNPYPVGPWEERQRREQGPSFQESVMDPINQGLGTLVDNQRIQLAQKRQAMMDEYLQQEQARKQQEHNYQFGTPIDPNLTSVSPYDQNMRVGRSSFMPGGQGRVAAASPLIEQFNQYRASNYPKDQARPEFMQAMGAKEREMVFERDNPKPASIFMNPYQAASIGLKNEELDLKKQEVDRKRQEEEKKRTEAQSALEEKNKLDALSKQGTIDLIDKALTQIGPMTTGIQSKVTGLFYQPTEDLKETLEAIGSQLATGKIMEMRQNSRTGAGLGGNTSDRDIDLLKKNIASLAQGQGGPQLAENLASIREVLNRAIEGKPTGGRAGGKIRVRNRQTGQTGSISEKFFDPNKYERVQ